MNKKITRTIITLTFITLLLFSSTTAFADDLTDVNGDGVIDINDTTLVTGSDKLMADIQKLLYVFVPAILTVAIIGFLLMRGKADEHERKQWNNRIIACIVCIVLCYALPSLIQVLPAYFGG